MSIDMIHPIEKQSAPMIGHSSALHPEGAFVIGGFFSE
jgi:hypothetical protein